MYTRKEYHDHGIATASLSIWAKSTLTILLTMLGCIPEPPNVVYTLVALHAKNTITTRHATPLYQLQCCIVLVRGFSFIAPWIP